MKFALSCKKCHSLFKMTTFDTMQSANKETFTLLSQQTSRAKFYDWQFTSSGFSSNHVPGDRDLLGGPFTISPTLEPHGFNAELLC